MQVAATGEEEGEGEPAGFCCTAGEGKAGEDGERGGGGGEGGGGGGGAFLMGDQQQLSFPSRLGLHPILAHQRFCLADLQLCMIDGGLFSKLVVRCSTSKFPPLYNFNCKAIYHLPMQFVL